MKNYVFIKYLMSKLEWVTLIEFILKENFIVKNILKKKDI